MSTPPSSSFTVHSTLREAQSILANSPALGPFSSLASAPHPYTNLVQISVALLQLESLSPIITNLFALSDNEARHIMCHSLALTLYIRYLVDTTLTELPDADIDEASHASLISHITSLFGAPT